MTRRLFEDSVLDAVTNICVATAYFYMAVHSFASLADKRVWKTGMLHLKKRDKRMATLISKFGMLESRWGPSNPYEAIVDSFIYQQISGSAAASIVKRFRELYGGRLPSPHEFLRTPQSRVRRAGISPQKYSYIKNLCQRLVDKELDLKGLAELPDEEVIAVLDDVKGIGRWTAEMFLMFSLRRVDVFPVDDLGIQNAVREIYGLRGAINKEKMQLMAEKWRPYRTIASLYLWRSQD